VFGRVICAQLIDVVSFLHSHAVIHRDIKPDNMIISGISSKHDIWSEEGDEKDDDDEPLWDELLKRWHLTLIDFGFARSLRPEDVETDVGLQNSIHVRMDSLEEEKNEEELDRFINNAMVTKERKRINKGGGQKTKQLFEDKSISKKAVRQMSAVGSHSAVGSRVYSAPEVRKGVREVPLQNLTRTLSKFVSDYGMVADAFSVGSIIRYLLTGVPPDEQVEDVIAAQNHPLVLLCNCILGNVQKTKRYRAARELPKEAARLVRGMTHPTAKKRTTVRAARLYPWIDNVFANNNNRTVGSETRMLEVVFLAQDPSAIVQ